MHWVHCCKALQISFKCTVSGPHLTIFICVSKTSHTTHIPLLYFRLQWYIVETYILGSESTKLVDMVENLDIITSAFDGPMKKLKLHVKFTRLS